MTYSNFLSTQQSKPWRVSVNKHVLCAHSGEYFSFFLFLIEKSTERSIILQTFPSIFNPSQVRLIHIIWINLILLITHSDLCFSSADGRKEGGPTAAPSEEDVREELKESGGAATEGAGTLPADAAAAVPTGHAHSARLLPALSPLCESVSSCYSPSTCARTQ